MPTHEEVAQLTENVQRECLAALTEENISGDSDVAGQLFSLLADVESITATISLDHQKWQDEHEVTHRILCTIADEDNVGLILTAAERRRLHNLPDVNYELEYSGHELPLDAATHHHEPFNKRRKISTSDDLVHCTTDFVQEFALEDEKEHFRSVHDSGISLLERPSQDDDCESRISYRQLAESGDDFDGLEDDLDQLFGDIDPIHFNDFSPLVSDSAHSSNVFSDPGLHTVGKYPTESDSAALDRITNLSPSIGNDTLSYSAPIKLPEKDITNPVLSKTIGSQDHARVILQEHSTADSQTGLLDAISAKRSLEEFMKLRSKISIIPTDSPSSVTVDEAPEAVPVAITFDPPAELIDHDVAHMLTSSSSVTTFHRYLGSLDVIQKLGLTRALSLPESRVQLVERETLGGADIVTDPHTAVILSPLRVLPSQYDSLLAQINQLSWRFSRILVIFETVSLTETCSSNNILEVNPFSPPVVKAVKKLKRDMEIAGACLDKRESTRVHFAFPMSTRAAAKLIREYGDIGHAEDTSGGQLWDDRLWLETDVEDLVRLFAKFRRMTNSLLCTYTVKGRTRPRSA
jgi:hypothetical protein